MSISSDSPALKLKVPISQESEISDNLINHNQPPQILCQPVKKREDAISWDDYFMAVSFLSAMRSKDPSTQVGACVVNSDKRIVGIGYNGFPRGCRYVKL